MGESRIFESWLEEELHRAMSAQPGPTPLASHARYRAAVAQARPGLVSTLTARSVALLAAAALALGGGGVALATAATGSVDPVSWGHAIIRAVQPVPPGGRPALDRPSEQPTPAGGRPVQPGSSHDVVGSTGTPNASPTSPASQGRDHDSGSGHASAGNGHPNGGNGKTDKPKLPNGDRPTGVPPQSPAGAPVGQPSGAPVGGPNR